VVTAWLERAAIHVPPAGRMTLGLLRSSSGPADLDIYTSMTYFARSEAGVIWMLTIYAKNVAETISSQVLRRIRREIEDA